MKIHCFTPAARGSVKGNRVTAERWKRCLTDLGHEVRIIDSAEALPCDLSLAIHAGKSAEYTSKMKKRYPETPVILCLSGTDLYRDIHRDNRVTSGIESADRLIVLQKHALTHLRAIWVEKTFVITQSCEPPRVAMQPLKHEFEVVVVGHLRSVKDPFRAAMAVRKLPANSKIHIHHLGTSLSETLHARAIRESNNNQRYHYEGLRPWEATLQRIQRARLLVLSSKVEGGANVLSEAICCGTPVLASRISGSIGILGDNYPGLFEVGNTKELRALLWKCETTPSFYKSLTNSVRKLAKRYTPLAEKRAWQALLATL